MYKNEAVLHARRTSTSICAIQEECQAAEEGEVWYDEWFRDYISSCGEECVRIHLLPVYHLSLSRHKSHMGELSQLSLLVRHLADTSKMACAGLCTSQSSQHAT